MATVHDSFTLTRDIAAPPARVFAAWSDPAKKRAWFVDSDGPEWSERDYTLDFRTGGRETGRFILGGTGPGAGTHENATTFLQIEPDSRIVFAYTMALNGRIHTASLATVEIFPDGPGSRLVYTEQMAVLGPSDGAAGRANGWNALLDCLVKSLAKETAA